MSRLARNVVDFLRTVRKLAERGIGILFESEAIFSLNSNSQLALSFQATMAEEESRVRSRSMETSLRMRLDHGLPLTPELLGFMHDQDGKLIKNPETYKIPKLMFYMYLYGYSTQQIAEKLTVMSKRTYLGNIKWTSTGVARTLRSERYCGDVRTRKTFTRFEADIDHDDTRHKSKTQKNRGERPQSYYHGEHEAIVTPDDYLATQRIMNNAKYGGTSLLPELRVIPEGLLKGFVIVHPRWGSFTKEDYLRASESVMETETAQDEYIYTASKGEFDLQQYEVADPRLFDESHLPAVKLQREYIKFSASCIKRMGIGNYVELLVHPIKKKVAIRPTTKENKYAIHWAVGEKENMEPRQVACKAYIDRIFELFEWKLSDKYKLYGSVYRNADAAACIFSESNSVVYIHESDIYSNSTITAEGENVSPSRRRIRAMPDGLGIRFGRNYYEEKSFRELENMTEQEWKTQIEGQLCQSGPKLNVTPYEELRAFIQEELGEFFEEVKTA